MRDERWICISDLQIPFEHEKALSFCVRLSRHFQIPNENVLCVGDEVDQLHGGQYPKDPNGHHTPNSEIKAARDKIAEWGAHFPQMKIAISNHGMRWAKKASAAEIPSQMMRAYQEVLHTPAGWQWKDQWVIQARYPFRMIHGCGYSGSQAHRTAALDGGMSTVMGHLHSHAGIAHIVTSGQAIWGANAGCLIDTESYAFNYGKDSRFKPCLGVVVVCNSGRTPMYIPLE